MRLHDRNGFFRAPVRVLVGAPSADTSEYQGTAVRRAGAVYKCNPLAATNDNCTMLQFDLHGNAFDRSGNHSIEEKSHQWLGATVASAGADGPIVACAPRYLLTTFGRDEQLVGVCFVADADFTSVVEFHPCEGGPYGFAFQSYGMAGFSAAITGERVFMGAPCSQSCHGEFLCFGRHAYSLLDENLKKILGLCPYWMIYFVKAISDIWASMKYRLLFDAIVHCHRWTLTYWLHTIKVFFMRKYAR